MCVETFAVQTAGIWPGGCITLKANIASTTEALQQLIVDYAVHYVKKRGGSSKKVFNLKEVNLAPGDQMELSISQVVLDFTTCKHYPSHHLIERIVNGETVAEGVFKLKGWFVRGAVLTPPSLLWGGCVGYDREHLHILGQQFDNFSMGHLHPLIPPHKW